VAESNEDSPDFFSIELRICISSCPEGAACISVTSPFFEMLSGSIFGLIGALLAQDLVSPSSTCPKSGTSTSRGSSAPLARMLGDANVRESASERSGV